MADHFSLHNFKTCFSQWTRLIFQWFVWCGIFFFFFFCLLLRVSNLTAGLLLPFISSLQQRAHCCPSRCYFFPMKKRRMNREHPALFSSFLTPRGVFVVHCVAELPPTLPTRHPCGLPSDLRSGGGTKNFKLFSSCKCSAALKKKKKKRAPVWDGATETGEGFLQWAVSFCHLFSRETCNRKSTEELLFHV